MDIEKMICNALKDLAQCIYVIYVTSSASGQGI
jgi:hypothetical protein